MPDSKLNRILLTKFLGPTAGLISGDFLTRDRWLWLKARLPCTANGETLLDVGCGTGAFTIGAALRGYESVGLTWDKADCNVAAERARLCNARNASFRVCDVRYLDTYHDFKNKFNFAICCENIEHVLDDRRLAIAMFSCLKPGGRLLLTTPNYHYRPITRGDLGPFSSAEDGGHVRRGYSEAQLKDLFAGTGFIVERVSFCSGFFSQKTTSVLWSFPGKAYPIGWGLTLPMRTVVPLLDKAFHRIVTYPFFSICIEAYKPMRQA